MIEFIYYSFVIVGTIMAVRFLWDSIKWAFKFWYRLVSLIIIGVLLLFVLVPFLFDLAFKILLH